MLHVNFLLLRLLQDFILALVCISASELRFQYYYYYYYYYYY